MYFMRMVKNIVRSLRLACMFIFPGDPTVFGNLQLCDTICDAVCKSVRGQKANGYCASIGMFLRVLNNVFCLGSFQMKKKVNHYLKIPDGSRAATCRLGYPGHSFHS